MRDIQRLPSPIRFGIFEVDPSTGELRRHGSKVKLQEQPFQVLMMLLERPGEIVTREEFQRKLLDGGYFRRLRTGSEPGHKQAT
jgi:DNA-binding winged helix-turn-helix (wHTH) protein